MTTPCSCPCCSTRRASARAHGIVSVKPRPCPNCGNAETQIADICEPCFAKTSASLHEETFRLGAVVAFGLMGMAHTIRDVEDTGPDQVVMSRDHYDALQRTVARLEAENERFAILKAATRETMQRILRESLDGEALAIAAEALGLPLDRTEPDAVPDQGGGTP